MISFHLHNLFNLVINWCFRYVDIFLGLLLFVSLLSLLYGAQSSSKLFIIIFIILSVTVMVVYWCWYIYSCFNTGDISPFDSQVA